MGFWLVASGRSGSLIGIPVLLLFIASLIYLGVSSWRLLLMMLGSGVLILSGAACFDIASKARKLPEKPGYYRGRILQSLFVGFILIAGGIYLFVLSILKSLG